MQPSELRPGSLLPAPDPECRPPRSMLRSRRGINRFDPVSHHLTGCSFKIIILHPICRSWVFVSHQHSKPQRTEDCRTKAQTWFSPKTVVEGVTRAAQKNGYRMQFSQSLFCTRARSGQTSRQAASSAARQLELAARQLRCQLSMPGSTGPGHPCHQA